MDCEVIVGGYMMFINSCVEFDGVLIGVVCMSLFVDVFVKGILVYWIGDIGFVYFVCFDGVIMMYCDMLLIDGKYFLKDELGLLGDVLLMLFVGKLYVYLSYEGDGGVWFIVMLFIFELNVYVVV